MKGLQRCPGPIQLLCARAVDSAVTEVVHLTDNDNIISHECLANDYKQTKLQAAAPSTECWQQMIADIATANTAGQAEDCDASNDSMNRLHDLYEWVGAMNCGIQGGISRPCSTSARLCLSCAPRCSPCSAVGRVSSIGLYFAASLQCNRAA